MNEIHEPDKVIAIDLPRVSKQSLLISLAALFILFALNAGIKRSLSFNITFWNLFLFVAGYIILIVLHELFHLLGFRLFGRVPWKKMIVGVNLKLGIAYATTDQLMTNKAIRKALLLPFWMTGVVPAVVGIYFGHGVLISLSALLIGGAAGDFAMYKQLFKLPDDWLVRDDPKLPRLYVYSPNRII
ncbi:DUF3267 domain-containing protein [Sporosarcina limicola]|uniref:Zincin peptidase n=1 Tax=Sporosarcina limicola TaxID=34101 RepID=A0A927MS91_9BACL|nr:DUF3267 domain-containing protein [Sporosarcina limicola]MBE1556509.1 hypothetical protein [Sporosarcina limicola]